MISRAPKLLSKQDTMELLSDAVALLDKLLDVAAKTTPTTQAEAAEVLSVQDVAADVAAEYSKRGWYTATGGEMPDWSYDTETKILYVDRGDGKEIAAKCSIPRG